MLCIPVRLQHLQWRKSWPCLSQSSSRSKLPSSSMKACWTVIRSRYVTRTVMGIQQIWVCDWSQGHCSNACTGWKNPGRGRRVPCSAGSGGAGGPGSTGRAGSGDRGGAQRAAGSAGRAGASSWSFTTLWTPAAGGSGQGAQPGETQHGAQYNPDWSPYEGHNIPIDTAQVWVTKLWLNYESSQDATRNLYFTLFNVKLQIRFGWNLSKCYYCKINYVL